MRVKHSFTRQDVKSPIKARSADVYAAFLRRHIRPDMAVLDYRCGEGTIAVRNSRFPGGPALLYTHSQMSAFLGGIKDGEFDHVLS